MKAPFLVLFLSFIAFTQAVHCQPFKPHHSPVYYFADVPIWFDEFNDEGQPDSTKWRYQTGGEGWGNNELQFYTKSLKNARVEKGHLIIEAHHEKEGANNYTSARLNSKGNFLYGKIVVRAKLPKGIGTWPAIWMLFSKKNYGDKGWPDNGEIDIMEHVGFDQNKVHGNIHTKAFNHTIGTNKGNQQVVEDVSEAFHIYSCEWTPEKISIAIDKKTFFEFEKNKNFSWQEWPFDQPFHVILNLAIGGNWGGQKGVDNSIFPQRMEIDYVRVFPMKESE